MTFENKNLTQHIDSDNLEYSIELLSDKFSKEYPGSRLIYLTQTGSVLHGTNSENSDLDIKGIYIPSIESLITDVKPKVLNLSKDGKNAQQSKNGAEDIDLTVYPVNDFLDKLSRKMDNHAIEILFSMFSDKILLETKESNIIKNNYKSLIYNSTEALTRFAISQTMKYSDNGERIKELDELIEFFKDMEMPRSQMSKKRVDSIDFSEFLVNKKYIRIEERVNNEGGNEVNMIVLNRKMLMTSNVLHFVKFLDSVRNTYSVKEVEEAENGANYKAFAHAIRAIREAKELVETGFIKYPLSSAVELKDLKYNQERDVSELFDLMEKEDLELQSLKNSSFLSNMADSEVVNEIKIKMYERSLKPKSI